jgi:hypothetical protein
MSVAAQSCAKACWYIAAALAVSGYFAIVAPAEGRIGAIAAQTDALVAQVSADERAVRDADRLNRLQHAIAQELTGVNLGTDRAGIMAEFLRDLHERSAAHRIHLVSVQNELAATTARPVHPALSSDPFETAAVDVVLEGRYAAVLHTIEDLSRSRVLTKIESSSLDRARGTQDESAPVLTTQLKLVVFYLRTSPPSDGHATQAT